MVNDIARAIETAFLSDRVPTKDELVKFDGFDEPEKEWTLESFLGRSRDEIDKLISDGPMGTMSYVESLSVMEPYGFQYYFPAYLLYVLRVQNLEQDDTVHFTFFYLNEALRIRGKALMTDDQIKVVQSVCNLMLEKLSASTSTESMIENIRSILQKLGK